MVRTAIADDYLLKYIANVASEDPWAVGLILGQSCAGKDYVIHFAKTPLHQPEELKKEGLPAKPIESIADISEKLVADHACQATRMLPGGMFVLGIFVISPDDLLGHFNSKIKSILNTIHTQLERSQYLYGIGDNEKLVLNYSSKSGKYSSKSYDTITSRVQPVDFKFLPKASKWYNVECSYLIDLLYYIKADQANYPLQKHLKGVLDDVSSGLENCVFLFDGESKDGDDSLENIGKKKKVPRSVSTKSHLDSQDITKPIKVSIYQSFETDSSKQDSRIHEAFESLGPMRIYGQVVCKLWLQPKMSIDEASKAVKQDILRSLYTRFEMHYDSLTEEENSEDINSVHEPPRRVLITLPTSKIMVSDYLFPGEGPQDAKLSLEELMDIKVGGQLKIQDLEGQADISEYYNTCLETDSEEILPKLPTDANKFMYVLGLGAALLILIISLLVHFYK